MFFRLKKLGPREYLQIVHNRREKGKVKQEVIATIGRLDVLRSSGSLDSLGIKFSEKLAFIDSYKNGQTISARDSKIGIPMVFGRLWTETGIHSVIKELSGERKFQFSVERAIFLTVLHRLSVSGSDRVAEKWREDYKIEGMEGMRSGPLVIQKIIVLTLSRW
jgi:hypothetical protein